MSASNWTNCPQCLGRAAAEADHARAEVMALYGTIPVEEFDAKRAALPETSPADSEIYTTFREDYEFYGAEDGEIHASYAGACSVCGLSVTLATSKRFYPGKHDG